MKKTIFIVLWFLIWFAFNPSIAVLIGWPVFVFFISEEIDKIQQKQKQKLKKKFCFISKTYLV